MLGIINKKLVFEFRDESSLSNALFHHMPNCSIIIATDKSDRVKAVFDCYNKYTRSNQLLEEKEYILYGTDNVNYINLGINDELPTDNNWDQSGDSFIFRVQSVPKPII